MRKGASAPFLLYHLNMASMFNKEVLRSVTGSPGRFLAIFAIVALGVGFYAGLRMTAPDMRLAADAFYDASKLMDLRVASTMGMAEGDVDAIRAVEGVEEVMGAYEADVMADIGGEPYTVRVHSLPLEVKTSVSMDEAMAMWDEVRLNDLVLAEGRLPSDEGECVMSADRIMSSPLAVGDIVRISEMGASEPLRMTEYKVVGLVHAPYYASSATMGASSLGSGSVEQFMYVPRTDFADDYPMTEAFVTVSGARDTVAGGFGYQSLVDDVKEELAGIAGEREQARLDELKRDAQEELDSKRREFEAERDDAYARLDEAAAELDSAKERLDSSESQLAEGERRHQSGVRELAAKRQESDAQLSQAQSEIDARAAELESARAALAEKEAELEAGWRQAAALGVTPQNVAQEIEQLKAQLALLPEGDPRRDQLAQQAAMLEDLASGQQAADAAKAQLDEGAARLAAGRGQLESSRIDAQAQLAQGQAFLDAARREIDDGRRRLEEGRAAYGSGLAEYGDSKAQAESELADAERRLSDAQDAIDALEAPKWLVMDRTKNHGAEGFDSDAGRVDSIAQLFPFVFFLVAALVALTSMTRMVDEERMKTGTLKALGYSRARIASKYLLYAGAASVGGSLVGIALLAFTLPAIIMAAYSIVYIVPIANLQIDWPIAATATLLGVGVTLTATAFASVATLRESPAALMLPKAPRAGKRILLERMRPLWSRLSFLWKVTCRNIFRYKKRLFMTVAGIAGCTALLLTGFGLQDSINDIIDKHYGELIEYNAVVSMEPDATAEDRQALEGALAGGASASKVAMAYDEPMAAVGEGGELSVQLIVPEDLQAFEGLWHLRDRLTHEAVPLGDEGAVVTEKVATRFGLAVGDMLSLAEQDEMGNAAGDVREVPVVGIAENYIGHSVFMSPPACEDAFGSVHEPNEAYLKAPMSEQDRATFAQQMQGMDAVKTVSFNDETIDAYKTALKSVNMVVVVLIVAAALLAFIVLYNLTSINVAERMREIATLKVLGFTRREVDLYIFREMLILAALGAAIGLVLGIFLENFVVTTAEVDAVMFGRDIHGPSFVLAFAMTMAFAAAVAVAMRGKLDGIDMVESLKSNE